LQSAFLRAHRALSSVILPEQPRVWLYQIVKYLLTDAGRQEQRQRRLTSSLRSSSTKEERDILAQVPEATGAAFQTVARSLPLFIEQLSSPYREALQLTEIEGLSQADAAARAGVSLSCMKARVRRGREKVKQALVACCAFEKDGRGRVIACKPHSADSTQRPACGCDN
jgi:RNA polymerase sigma-70 factor (ECF subfamily)